MTKFVTLFRFHRLLFVCFFCSSLQQPNVTITIHRALAKPKVAAKGLGESEALSFDVHHLIVKIKAF